MMLRHASASMASLPWKRALVVLKDGPMAEAELPRITYAKWLVMLTIFIPAHHLGAGWPVGGRIERLGPRGGSGGELKARRLTERHAEKGVDGWRVGDGSGDSNDRT